MSNSCPETLEPHFKYIQFKLDFIETGLKYIFGTRMLLIRRWALWFIESTIYSILNSSCNLNMFSFPYDTQDCSLDFGNVLEPAEIVNISTASTQVDLQSFYESSEFEVDSPRVTRLSFNVSIGMLMFNL